MADKYLVLQAGDTAVNYNGGGRWFASDLTTPVTDPTSADNIFMGASAFPSASQSLVVNSTANCLNMDWTGATNSPTLAYGTNTINIYGSRTYIAAMTITGSGDSEIYRATGTGNTLTQNGADTSQVSIAFSGAGGGWTIADALNIGTKAISHNRGTLNTGNQTITCGAFSSTNLTASTLTMGSSTINCTSWSVVTGVTVSANTSTINVTGTGAFAGGNITTYNNINLNGTAHTVSGNFTAAKLARNGTNTKTDSITFTSGQTITLTDLDLIGNAAHAYDRLDVKTTVLGSPATITCTNKPTISQADLHDITLPNAADYSAQDNVGDGGGNTGITFPVPVAQSSTKVSTWSDSTMWTSRIPLPQDDVTCSHNVTADMPRIGKSIAFTGTPTATLSNAVSVYGSLVLSAGTTWADTGGAYVTSLAGRGNYTLNTQNKSFRGITLSAPGGTYTLASDITTGTSSALTANMGTLTVGAHNVTIGLHFILYTATVNMGSGIWTLNNATADVNGKWRPLGAGTINAETSTIVLTNSTTNAQKFNGGGYTYNNVTVSGAGAYALTITGNNTFLQPFRVDASQAVKSVVATGTTQTVPGITRDGGTKVITITGGTWVKTGGGYVNLDYMSISNSTASPANSFYAGKNSIDGGGNTGWAFLYRRPYARHPASRLRSMSRGLRLKRWN